jgi:hypothetical protein
MPDLDASALYWFPFCGAIPRHSTPVEAGVIGPLLWTPQGMLGWCAHLVIDG